MLQIVAGEKSFLTSEIYQQGNYDASRKLYVACASHNP